MRITRFFSHPAKQIYNVYLISFTKSGSAVRTEVVTNKLRLIGGNLFLCENRISTNKKKCDAEICFKQIVAGLKKNQM